MIVIGLALLTLTTLWIVLGAIAVARVRFQTRNLHLSDRPVTILKPLAGADSGLEVNLRTFFEQDHRQLQLVFGVERENDPAIAVVRKLIAAHPAIDATLVIRPGHRAMNPKVSNLKKMIGEAKHDLLLISDSNVRAPRSYVRDMVAVMEANDAGLVTNAFAGCGEKTIGAALENVQLNGFVAAGAALPTMLEDPAVVGKSMLFSRRELEALGGFDRVSDVLAEDFIIGKMFQEAGRSVHIAREVLHSINGRVTIKSALDRQLRWSMLRIRLRPLAFLFEPLTSPLAMLPLAFILFGGTAVLWAVALILIRDVGQWIVLRGRDRLWIPILLAPFREMLMLGVWAVTPFVKHISWRGNKVRIGAGTIVYQSA